jgi:hypothetical protein
MTGGLRIPFGGASGFAKVGGGKRSPTIDELIGLQRHSAPNICTDRLAVAYTVPTTGLER